jgi:tetratricopeptide (TPR) repeat protein
MTVKKLFNLSSYILVIFLSISLFDFAQKTNDPLKDLLENGSEQLLVSENSRMMQEDLFYDAEKIADKLLTLKPESANYNYRKGFVRIKIDNDAKGAIPYLEKAILNTDKNYDAYGVSEKSAPIDAFYHLATCYHQLQEIDQAIAMYNKFITNSSSKSELVPVAKMNIEQCGIARELMAKPSSGDLKNVGANVNSQNPEYAPVISLDGSSLYYTSKRPWSNGESDNFRSPSNNYYPEDVYVSFLNLQDSTFNQSQKLDFCGANKNEATVAVNSDERKIYIYQDSAGTGDIYFSDFFASKFNAIQKLDDASINSKYWETHCMTSHDGKYIFFASDRPGGFGGLDIYMMAKTNDNSWTKPINLGAKINTPYNEDAPFISIDNKKLFFSSNGSKSMGGYDILSADLSSDGTWGEAINLGYPINTPSNEIYYTTTIDGTRGYLSSNREGGYGNTDIYEIFNTKLGLKNMAVFKGDIKTTDGSPLPEDFVVNMKIICEDCDDYDKNRTIYPRLRDGLFMTSLQPCKSYKIIYFNASDNKEMHSESFTTECNKNYQEIERELLLDVQKRQLVFPKKDDVVFIPEVEVSTFENIQFKHIFEYNKNKLFTNRGNLKDFVKDIDKQFKKGRDKITIKIYSSASKVPTTSYETNEKLSQLRAENMKYDLIEYFESNDLTKGKVIVTIVSAVVDGPEYENDYKNRDKYEPFQYVTLKTE